MTPTARTPSPDISIIVVSRSQSRIIHHTLRSVQRAAAYAHSHSLECEVIIAVNSRTKKFHDYLANLSDVLDGISHRLSYYARPSDGNMVNLGVSSSHGDYITIISEGDMMSEDWLVDSINIIKSADRPVIIHPQYSFWYGRKDSLREFKASNDKSFIPESMVEYDNFPDIMMMTSRLARAHIFTEDENYSWIWNIKTLSDGIEHLIAPKTLYAKHIFVEQADGYSSILPKLDYLGPQGRQHELNSRGQNLSDQTRTNRILQYSRNGLERLYRSFPSRLVRRSHPRLDAYITSLLNETRHLLRPIVPLEYKFPDWVESELRALHQLDLRVFPTNYLRFHIEVYDPSPGSFTRAYWELAEQIGNDVDILFLVPYLKNGGAEREIANQTAAVLKLHPTTKIKILATETSDSPGVSMLDKRIEFIEAGANFGSLSLSQQARLLVCLISQLSPKKVHLVTSLAGYIALQDFSATIAKSSKIFITIFTVDKTSEGRDTHKFTECLTDAIDNVQKVYTDNQAIAMRLVQLMGIDRKKFQVLYQPTDLEKFDTAQRFNSKPVKVLWAGRLDRSKRPDILAAIAEQARKQECAVEFHAYGSAELDDFNYQTAFKNVPELHYHGGYQGGLRSLDLNTYDIFLMTSEWEGYPNALLEAISGGLLPIVPAVGGIPELIEDGKTGFIVKIFDDTEAYVKAIEKAVSDPELANRLIKQAQALVKRRHSQAVYEKLIESQKEYLD